MISKTDGGRPYGFFPAALHRWIIPLLKVDMELRYRGGGCPSLTFFKGESWFDSLYPERLTPTKRPALLTAKDGAPSNSEPKAGPHVHLKELLGGLWRVRIWGR